VVIGGPSLVWRRFGAGENTCRRDRELADAIPRNGAESVTRIAIACNKDAGLWDRERTLVALRPSGAAAIPRGKL